MMRKIKIFLPATFVIFSALIFCCVSHANAQLDSQKVFMQRAIPQNAGFDVIVKMNGDILYGLVKEVGPYYISYQRTDIPDGPVYRISRSEVYVISYRNQVKDYINGMPEGVMQSAPYYPGPDYRNFKKKSFFDNYSSAKIGIGFLRSFSKVENVKDYSSSASFPVLSLAYEVFYEKNIQLGLELGFGTHKFSNQKFSSYDSTNNNVSLTEHIFGLHVYGKYLLGNNSSKLQPYILAGLGIASSNILSENRISFTNDNTQEILVKSGSRATGLNITARVGGEYFINNQMNVFADAGIGLSVIKIGFSFEVNDGKH